MIPRQTRRLVTGRQWYHQRFDGAPLYIFMVGQGELAKEKRKPAGTEANVRVSYFHDGKGDWYLDMADVRRGARVIIEQARRDPAIGRKLLTTWRRDEQTFDQFFERFDRRILAELTDEALLILCRHYLQLFHRRITSSAVIDHFALGSDQYIADLLRQEVGKLDNESRFTEIFSIATAPVHQSFINKSEMDLLKIAIERPNDRQAIERYQQKYYWVHNNYFSAFHRSVGFFTKEISAWRQSSVDLKTKYRALRDTPRRNATAKTALFRRYRFSRHLRTLLKLSEEFTWWQDERKRATYWNIDLGHHILGAMARRRHLPSELAKYLTPDEVEAWWTTGRPTATELRRRQRGCAIVMTRAGSTVFTGREITKLHDRMFPAKQSDAVKDIRGLSASVGRVTGPVRVITSVQQIGKVKPGDILVAVMTRPDYIAGIKKAAAIVTNEGGITCHAAIVSRELGIPCVIGTKIATEVFHDNDRVEVNANHGVVTLISRS